MSTATDRLIAIVDLQQILQRNDEVEAVVRRGLDAGVRNLLLRAKGVGKELVDEVNWPVLIERIERAAARVILHDSLLYARPDLAEHSTYQHWSAATLMAHAARSSNIPNKEQEADLTPGLARRTPFPFETCARFGVSAHNSNELRTAQAHGAAWAFVSPYASTTSKPGYGPVLGVTGTRALCAQTTLPTFALGGVDANRAVGVANSGISGVVVMGMLTNPKATLEIKALLNQMESEEWTRQTPWS